MATFSVALSGLTASNSALGITSNNIANSNTTGFKSSQAEFGTVFSSGAVNLNTSTGGEGVQLVDSPQQFTQGDITTTSSPLDMAISGNGFFTMASPSGYVYTRNGEFQEDNNGNVVSATGQFLQVYPPLANGGFNTGALQNLNLNTAQSAPVATTTGNVIVNLPSNATQPTATPFDPTNSNSYNQSTSTTVYDSLGNSYPATFYFSQTATPGLWDVNMTVNGTAVGGTQTLQFSSTGAVTAPANGQLAFAGFTPTDGAAPMTMNFNFGQTTQYGTAFGVSSITQNGYTTGQLSTVSVDSTGVVSAVYTNGRSTELGQLAIANFPNPQGLQQLSDTNWAQTFTSGTVVQGTAGSSGFGTVQASSLENSNVDLTTELVNMITEQRAFQANAQVITTADQMSQTVIGIATNG
ncbi:MAG TPA: flagellar hook protein FlgE [Steroidobacteraceae bacterium]|jgi:flagellar hook protein FlgE|nr:flagellar hook protein FlgE [Steroidobacteraceae bacterium]